MKNDNSYFVIGLSKNGDKSINHFVEEIQFRNHHFGDFKNVTLQFTDDLRFALRIKSKVLADNLAFVTRKALPELKIDVLLFDESWLKL